MPAFTYRAATAQGRTLGGVEDAVSATALERSLSVRGLYPLEVSAAETAAEAGQRYRLFRSRRGDVAEAVRYLAVLLGANFPLDRALGTTARVAAREDVAGALLDVRRRVRAGAPLADAMAEHPIVFPRLAVGMARAGDRGGFLGAALERLAGQLEREQVLRQRLASASLYPALMLAVGTGAVAVLLLYVLPRLVGMLAESNAPIPRSTALLLWAAQFAREWWLVIALASAAAALVMAAYSRTEDGHRAIDALLLRAPVVGALRRRLAAARFGRTLASLLGSGLSVLPALDIAADALTDAAVRGEVLRAREEVRAGGRLAPALGRGGAFPYVFVQMVEVGEDSGRVPEMLDRGAAAMEQDLERGLDALVRLAEPVMIVLLGGAAGFFALALLQAIYGVRADAL